MSSLSASEQGSRGAWVLFQGGRPVELAAFEDGPGEDAGRQAAWEQFDAAYELVSWNSSASTLSLFDGDDISRDGLEGLLEAWTEAGSWRLTSGPARIMIDLQFNTGELGIPG